MNTWAQGAFILVCGTLLYFSNIFFFSPEKKLILYTTATRANPTFALPEVDLPKLHTALLNLRKEEDRLLIFYNADEQDIIRTQLHPWKFLASLQETESARRAFLAQPSNYSKNIYHRKLMHSFEAYQLDVSAFTETLRTFREVPLQFAEGKTSTSFITQTLTDQLAHTMQAKEHEQRLFLCSSWWARCADSDTSWFTGFATSTEPFRLVLTPTEHRLLPILRAYQSSFTHKYDNLIEQKPSETPVVLLRTNCFGSSNKEVAFLPWFENDTPHSAKFTPVSELYFHNWSYPADNPLFAQLGITYEYQPYNPYFCINFGIDARRAFTALAIHRHLSAMTTQEKEYVHELIPEIHNPATVVSAQNMTDIARSFALILDSTPRDILRKNYGSLVEKMETVVLLEKTGSGMFEHIVAGLDDTLRRVVRSNTIEPIPLNHLLITRSYMALFLLPPQDTTEHSLTLLENPHSDTRSPLFIPYTKNKNIIGDESNLLNSMLKSTQATDALFGPREPISP